MKRRIDWDRFVPAGLHALTEVKWIGMGLAVSSVCSMGFLFRLYYALDALYVWVDHARKLIPGAIMVDFAQLIDGMLLGFAVLALCMPGLAIYHYGSHYRGSNSIYLMRRLPSRWELPKRCLTLPVCGASACAFCAFMMLLVYFGIYLVITPSECLAPGQWMKLFL